MSLADRTKTVPRVLAVALVLGVITSSASAQFTHWHNTENPPQATGNSWSDPNNWANDAIPGTGFFDAFRIEQYPADAALTGDITMDFDYSASPPLREAQFFGGERVIIQSYFKAITGGTRQDGIVFLNGSNNPNGAHLRVAPGGTIEADIVAISPNNRGKPTIEFAGGSWVAGHFRNFDTGQRSWGRQDIIFSSDLGTITPGLITTWSDGAEMNFIFNLVAKGVTPVTLTEPDPLRFTGHTAGKSPFNLSVDMSAYTGAATKIPLFIFENPDSDRLFDEAKITITGAPAGWEELEVVQSDDGVVLQLAGDSDGDGLTDSWEQSVIDADPDDAVTSLEDIDPAGNLDGDNLTNQEEFEAGTNPLDADTDDDFANDDKELADGTDPFDPDSDRDGLLDGHEDGGGEFVSPTQTGTDPLNPNTDGDLLPDGFEVENEFDPNDPDDPGAGNAVQIETVMVGSAGNPPDGDFGQVDYDYSIGKFEVTAGQYLVFLNAVAAEDTHGLWTPLMDRNSGCCGGDEAFGPDIKRQGEAGNYTYTIGRAEQLNRPMRGGVDYGNAMRFCNWLHNRQPAGAQDATTTEDGVYPLNGAVSNAALAAALANRQEGWRFALPTIHEWYKAAYHNPEDDSYFDYPTGSNSQPAFVNNDGNLSGTGDPFENGGVDPGNYATWQGDGGIRGIGSPDYATAVGEWENSASPWGTFDQMGNVDEMIETINEGIRPYLVGANAEHPPNASAGKKTSVGGGSWNPTDGGRFIGFRVVSSRLAEPRRPDLRVSLDHDSGSLVLTWDSMDGMLYNLLSDTTLDSAPLGWDVWQGHQNIPADQDNENTLIIPLPVDEERFFVIVEFPPPPLFEERFDGPALSAGWSAEDNGNGTSWQVGDVSGLPNLVNGSGTSAAATNLADFYTSNAFATLTSPAIAIPAEGAVLSFRVYLDNEFSDPGAIRLLDSDNDDAEIGGGGFPIEALEGIEDGWIERSFTFPASALGRNVRIQFEFRSNEVSNFTGMAIDDVTVD